MANVWPTTLPDNILSEFSESTQSNILSFTCQNGPEKRRRTSTYKRKFQSGSLQLTGAQVTILKGFYDTTLSGGIDTFDWEDMVTGATVSFRFVSEPKYSNVVPGPVADNRLYETTIELEVMG